MADIALPSWRKNLDSIVIKRHSCCYDKFLIFKKFMKRICLQEQYSRMKSGSSCYSMFTQSLNVILTLLYDIIFLDVSNLFPLYLEYKINKKTWNTAASSRKREEAKYKLLHYMSEKQVNGKIK